MHLRMISRNALHRLFQEIFGLLSTRMSAGSRSESSSFTNEKLAWLYCQTFRGIAGVGRGPSDILMKIGQDDH